MSRVMEVQQALREAAQHWKDTSSPLYNLMMFAADVIDDQQAKLLQWQTSSEAFAERIMGSERYGNSPCQANPLEALEQYLIEQHGPQQAVCGENIRLRAALARSDQPCVYCTLPAEDWAKCERGFPGCARGDDAAGCPELGAAMALHDLRDDLTDALQTAVDALHFVPIKAGKSGYRSGYLDGRANGEKSAMMAAQKLVAGLMQKTPP